MVGRVRCMPVRLGRNQKDEEFGRPIEPSIDTGGAVDAFARPDLSFSAEILSKGKVLRT